MRLARSSKWLVKKFFPCSVAYIRFDCADVEPQKGQFNWKFIDDAISAWKPRGAAVAIRVMTANAHSGGYYSSPKWLFDAGCKGFEYNVGGGDPTSGGRAIPRIEPDYADPIYLPASSLSSSSGRAQWPSLAASIRTWLNPAQARISESTGIPIFFAIWSAVLKPMP